MRVEDFDYYLPEELIAQEPLADRSSSRLLTLEKNTGKTEHKIFKDIVTMLNKGDCLVLNNTRVIPARLIGTKEKTGGAIEMLLLKRVNTSDWEVALKPGKRAKVGAMFVFGPNEELKAEILEIVEGGNRIVRFYYDGLFENVLDKLGQIPLPGYITKKLEDKERYQTVYAKYDGSAAAPTAGLHFTKELLSSISEKGVKIAYVTLHVGLGTFRPVKVDNIEEHTMHSEYFIIDEKAASIINETKEAGGRVIAVGTTSCRTLESAADENGHISPCEMNTSIFIYPGYKFKAIDALITNFHLPKSTLVMLVSALAGRENVLSAYKEAIENRYRFFSFGDAMFIK
ncbi:MAG: tRNA preQ1(34) S-adenosylmethionine ribosyltransferase-isomerase QueA [Clostridia bacterium]|nr:tRNA preQ1(34) S-adenosylmethionine ribosyltransferase-isomerase QueA [Clostridia bacterium]